MRSLLPGPGRGRRFTLAAAFASFGVGILLAFFLSPHILALIEALVIIAVAVLCLSEN